jgi:hypothetical protein
MSELKATPGPWRVRTREALGEVRDCFVAADDVNGFPYDAEILGEDEYRDQLPRRMADAHLIAAAPLMYTYIEVHANSGDIEAQRILAIARGEQ